MDRLRSPLPILPTRELPPPATGILPRDGLYPLRPGEARRFVAVGAVRIAVLCGRIWLTVAGDAADRFPQAGEAIELAATSDFAVEAAGPVAAVIAIERLGGSPVPATGARRLMAGWLIAIRSGWRRRLDIQALAHLGCDRQADIGLEERTARALWLRQQQSTLRRQLQALEAMR